MSWKARGKRPNTNGNIGSHFNCFLVSAIWREYQEKKCDVRRKSSAGKATIDAHLSTRVSHEDINGDLPR